jgi:hypothetical protein
MAKSTRRLLKTLAFPKVKLINDHFGLQPRKSKVAMIGQIVEEVGADLQIVVSSKGPFSLAQWNEIAEKLGGSPRKSFEMIAEEIKSCLDPAFDDLDADMSIKELREDSTALRILAGKLGIDRPDLDSRIQNTNGRTLLSTFVSDIRNRRNEPVSEEPLSSIAVRVASTRVSAESIEKLSQSWMNTYVAGANKIEIAAGFYDVDFISALLSRHKTVRIVRLLFNGLGGRRLKAQRDELQDLEQDLQKEGRTVEIRLAFAPGLFHSKLFLITKDSSTRALVGSANATGAAFDRNEEILVALADAGSLKGYFDSAWHNARRLDDLEVDAKSLIAFYRTGVLYFKPISSLPTTLNPFRELLSVMTVEHRRLLGAVRITYADQVVGIGPFNLKRAVQGDESYEEIALDPDDALDVNQASRASIRPYSIETCFGYWVPNALNDLWQSKLKEVSNLKKRKWVEFRDSINTLDVDFMEKYQQYLEDVRQALTVIPAPSLSQYLEKIKNPFDEEIFLKFFKRIQTHLEEPDRLARLTSPFVQGTIPEIWDDIPAYKDFDTSFFDYLDYVGRLVGNRPDVPKRILNALNVAESVGSDDLRDKFENYLRRGWTDEHWTRPLNAK